MARPPPPGPRGPVPAEGGGPPGGDPGTDVAGLLMPALLAGSARHVCQPNQLAPASANKPRTTSVVRHGRRRLEEGGEDMLDGVSGQSYGNQFYLQVRLAQRIDGVSRFR